jgi:hypothetical protein
MRVRLSGFVLHPLIPFSEVVGICTRVVQKVLKPLIYFSQNQQEMCAIFSVADLEYRWLLQHHVTEHFLARVQGVV